MTRRLLSASTASSAVIATSVLTIGQSPLAAQPATQPVVQQQQQPAADVPVRSVVLFSSGVGYFEHFGNVRGNESTELRFKTDQINDILKSLVLQDLDGGRVTTITYPSQDPISKQLKSFQVDIASNPSLAELLNQLRGAKVNAEVGPEKLTGTILGVEKKPKAVGETHIDVWVMNLVSGAMIRSVPLEEIRRLELQDPQLQDELEKALAALAGARDQDKKPVNINFVGDGQRRVLLGYVVQTPVWKTSYRLILPQGENAPKLQGWAIVENQTDNDWNDVQLSLVSGRPISFVQDLYQPLYIQRPVVEPELYASLRPQRYAGGREAEQLAKQRRDNAPAAPAAAAPERRARLGQMEENAAGDVGGVYFADKAAAMSDMSASISSLASASQVGELFQYTVGNVSLPRQKSAMIPIITDEVQVDRLSIYNMSVMPRNPLNGARLKNTTDKHLLQGPITVFDDNRYAGDAQIDNVPPGQNRLLSYGVDLQMLVDATKNKNDSAILTGKIVKGVLHLSRRHEQEQTYIAENKSNKGKTLLVEHQRLGGDWKLVDTLQPVETTDNLYRFEVPVAAGKSESTVVKQQIVMGEQVAILPADVGQIVVYLRSGAIPEPVKAVLQRAIEMKNAMTDIERQIGERDQRLSEITQEQNRIRENMRTVDRNSDYYNRLLTKLGAQESQIEKLQTENGELRQQLNARRTELESYLDSTSVG